MPSVNYPYPTLQLIVNGENAAAVVFNRLPLELQGNMDAIKSVVEALTATDVSAIPSSEKGASNGVATLGADGKVPQTQIPAIAITDVYVVADIPARDALTVQQGDVAVVQDTGSGEPDSYIYDGSAWQVLQKPADSVSSVNGNTGVVVLNASDVGAAPAGHVGSGGTAHPVASLVEAGFMSAADRSKVDGIAAGAEVNQYAFSTVKVGASTLNSSTKMDQVEMAAGDGIELTPDVPNKKVTVAVNIVDGGDV